MTSEHPGTTTKEIVHRLLRCVWHQRHNSRRIGLSLPFLFCVISNKESITKWKLQIQLASCDRLLFSLLLVKSFFAQEKTLTQLTFSCTFFSHSWNSEAMQRLRALNLFRDPFVVNNRHQLRNQIISTRIFLLCYTVSLLAYGLYLTFNRTTITVEISSPTVQQFNELFAEYPQTLSCSCINLSIRHQIFISLEPLFHEMCSKQFQSTMDVWIETLFRWTTTLTNHRDFRFTAALQLRLITLLCVSVQEIIDARMVDFNTTALTSPLLMNDQQFQQQIAKLVDQFIVDTINQFSNALQVNRITTFGSQVGVAWSLREECFSVELQEILYEERWLMIKTLKNISGFTEWYNNREGCIREIQVVDL